uniref:ribosomal protein L35 n=1 Tax=Goniotrichopsis reniformis TaxID=468933 RepID=UPI001FCCEB14|nr:ribosomal protein L35 [Goniotrichopsis reniformis]UNJ14799.1 ribosomal protein L35 [Goniotrichopsis reniformis]
MPKIKTCRAMAKRFRVTKTKKLLRKQAGKSHLLEKKSQGRKRALSKTLVVHGRDIPNMINKIPYL